jgi:FkbM family methyltransferase
LRVLDLFEDGGNTIRLKIKRLMFAALRVRVLNLFLREILRLLLPVLPRHILNRFPVVGKVYLPLPAANKALILVSDGGDTIASRLYWNGPGGFEPETVNLYMHLMKHARTVFDIGAHTGLFALLAAVDSSDRDVHAFEPVPRIFRYLLRNMQVNRLHNVKPVCSAVTDCDGEIALHIPSSVALPLSASTIEGFRETVETLIVPALKLDTYVATHSIAKIDLLKIDTEGTEHKVLEGARNVLKRDTPVIICEVLKGLTETSLHSIFKDTQYQFFLVTDHGLVHKQHITGDDTYQCRNYLFITTEKIPEYLEGINIGEDASK